MRTINAPGVEIKEIDKSQYSPAMVGTAAYIMGYTSKGEPIKPMEFTSRTAWTSFYGEPDNEAERYAYAAACEVLNNNGRLYFARMPYDNQAYGKIAAVQYTIKTEVQKIIDVCKTKEIIITPNTFASSSYEYLTGDTPVWDVSSLSANNKMSADIGLENEYPKLSTVITNNQLSLTLGLLSSVTQEESYIDKPGFEGVYDALSSLDSSLSTTIEVKPIGTPIYGDLSKVQAYEANEDTVGNTEIWIYDRTCATYNKVSPDSRKGSKAELIGIMPVITTPVNALYAQKMIDAKVEQISGIKTISGDMLLSTDFAEENFVNNVITDAALNFSTIQMNSEGTGLDRENLKKIGVVVYKMYLDPSTGNKVNITPVESFIGTLGKNDRDINTGASTFIDTIVNTNSKYIYLFSNISETVLAQADTIMQDVTNVASLGFYSSMTKEVMKKVNFIKNINSCLEKVSDINERDIDIVCDAGLANIFSYIEASGKEDNAEVSYDLTDTTTMYAWLNAMTKNSDAVKKWKAIEMVFDNFCKKVRKDCMFIADAPRPMVLTGNKKIVRPTKPDTSIDVNILPNIKWITGLNTSYGAGYLDWFEQVDDFSGDLFWCPPSIKAMGCYINTDVNYNYWDAPAGLTRGLIPATDVAFSPTMAQAGAIYEKNWNYAINYPKDGIVLEGQKTFQVKPSAFDRVNVRRLFLRLERAAYQVARYFVYEGNTAYTRQRLVDRLNPYFKEAKIGGGIYDYKIICDETINDPDTIDRNELKVKIGIKPVKTAEFILIDFIALSTGGSFEEAMG